MMKRGAIPAVGLLVCLLAQEVWAQGGAGGFGGGGFGGGGKPGGPGGFPGLPGNENKLEPAAWLPSLSQALAGAQGGGKHILLYVFDEKSIADPSEFLLPEVVQASKTNWLFVKRPYVKDDPQFRDLGVRKPGMLLGMDHYANEFRRADRIGLAEVRGILATVPDLVARFRAKLQADFARAGAEYAADPARSGRLYAEIARIPRKGYKEIEESMAKVRTVAERRFKLLELAFSVDEKEGLLLLHQIVADYKDLPPALGAEVHLAQFDREKGDVPSAVQRLKKVLKAEGMEAFAPEVERGKKVLDEIMAVGLARVTEALQGAQGTGRSKSAEALRQIAKEYAGTEVGAKAAEAMKKL